MTSLRVLAVTALVVLAASAVTGDEVEFDEFADEFIEQSEETNTQAVIRDAIDRGEVSISFCHQ